MIEIRKSIKKFKDLACFNLNDSIKVQMKFNILRGHVICSTMQQKMDNTALILYKEFNNVSI